MRKFYAGVLGGALMMAGCASQLLSDDRLRDNVAGAIGVSPGEVTIISRREQTPNTYCIVRTKAGAEYSCIVNGGSILAAGMVNPPFCQRK